MTLSRFGTSRFVSLMGTTNGAGEQNPPSESFLVPAIDMVEGPENETNFLRCCISRNSTPTWPAFHASHLASRPGHDSVTRSGEATCACSAQVRVHPNRAVYSFALVRFPAVFAGNEAMNRNGKNIVTASVAPNLAISLGSAR